MEKGSRQKENRIYFFLFLFVWCIQMLTAVSFCCQKQGFHEDEFYTYYSTARTNGLIIEDGAWMERDAYFNEFVVLDGQEFQYGLVRLVQSWDVHPPVYYWVFHTVCSLFPGQFSKWFGLSVNLAAFGLSLFLLRRLALQVSGSRQKLTLLVCLFYGFTPAAVSGVVFIRMYALLTVFVFLCAVLHMSVIECDLAAAGTGGEEIVRQERLSFGKFLLPLAVVTYFGFLTQYYYFIFLFFMAASFCLYLLWRDRNPWNCVRYGCSQAAAFVLAYLTYPSCLGQMFRGQRGAQATDNFLDLSNTWARLSFFWELMDQYVFGKMLIPLLGLLLVLTAFRLWQKRNAAKWRENGPSRNTAGLILAGAAVGYFLAVSKTALLLGDTSVRYQMPVYGMVVLLLFLAIRETGAGLFRESRWDRRHVKNVVGLAAVALTIIVNTMGLLSGHVVFLYPEAADRIALAKEAAARDIPAVCLYDVGQSWCVWACADEFFEYDRIYFAGQSDTEPISDEVIAGSKELIVYLSNSAEIPRQLQRILDSCPKLTGYELLYQEKYCDVYRFYEE